MSCRCGVHRFYIAGMLFMVLNLLALGVMAEETKYKPFVLAQRIENGEMAAIVDSVRQKLTQNGFTLAGQYQPYADTTILVATNDKLREHAAQSEFGAFGAILRISVSKTDKGIQVSYTNPTYMAHVYRLKTDLAGVTGQLASVLGHEADYGSEEGLSKDDLRDYQYKWLMPYFTDRHELVAYKSQQQAIEKVEQILAARNDGLKMVYRVDLPGKEETVIGIGLPGPADNDCSGDQYIMSRIDFKAVKSSGHLPYEVVIHKGKVYALYAEFRIAINFPDLSMMGSNSFASIMCAPNAIKKALTAAVGGKEGESDI